MSQIDDAAMHAESLICKSTTIKAWREQKKKEQFCLIAGNRNFSLSSSSLNQKNSVVCCALREGNKQQDV